MMYAWDENRERCYQLYVTEGKSMDEVMELMRLRYDFTPSRRSYQTQFRKWKFPAKHSPAYKNDELVTRVKELWGKNLSQKEMLRVLTEDDGFEVDMRDLQRLRARHRLLLRESGEAWTRRQSSTMGTPRSQPGGEDEGDADDYDGEEDATQSYTGASQSPAMDMSSSGMEGTPVAELNSPHLGGRRRDLVAESNEKLATRKRRRRTKGWAGFPADPPGPPRFPSETTLDQAKVILQLDADMYKGIRDRFRLICENAGIVKKTVAGVDKWEALKEQLVLDSMHLRAVMYGNEDTERKKLAIDVIACDVTKRMRMADNAVTMAEAKSILGLNPEQGREVRFAFYKILTDDQFTGKIMAGPEHWDALKQKWIDNSGLLQRILSYEDAGPDYQLRWKAFEKLARDVRKRYQEDSRAEKKPAPLKKHGGAKKGKVDDRPATPPQIMDQEIASYEVPQMSQLVMTPTTPNTMPQPQSATPPSQRSRQHVQRTPVAPPPEGLPGLRGYMAGQVLNPTQDLTLDGSLGASMLLGADPDGAFLNQPFYMPTQQPQVYHQPTPMVPYAIYLRLDPSSSFPAVTPMWIAMMNTQSLDQLRHVAVAKYPGSICLGVSGIIKDDKGGELPLAINDDAELGAYLGHMEGQGAPTFNVQIRVLHELQQGLATGLEIQAQDWA